MNIQPLPLAAAQHGVLNPARLPSALVPAGDASDRRTDVRVLGPSTGHRGVPRVSDEIAITAATLAAELVRYYEPVGPTEKELISRIASETAMLRHYASARLAAIDDGFAAHFALLEGMESMLPHHSLDGGAPGVPEKGNIRNVALAHAMSRPAIRVISHNIDARQRSISRLVGELEKHQRIRVRQATTPVRHATTSGTAGARLDGLSGAACAETPDDLLHNSVPGDAETKTDTMQRASTHSWSPCETEEQAEHMFRAWRIHAGLPCPHCGTTLAPTELARRRMLQCRDCHHQAGLRQGTILAHSNVTFLQFLRAVRLLDREPDSSLEDLEQATSLGRRTVRALRQRILATLADTSQRRQLLLACGSVEFPSARTRVAPVAPLPRADALAVPVPLFTPAASGNGNGVCSIRQQPTTQPAVVHTARLNATYSPLRQEE